jgi:anti-anti-sigma factor
VRFRASAVKQARGVRVVRLSGALDREAATGLAATLLLAIRRTRCVIVDLRELTRVDYAGVSVIAAATRSAHESGCHLVLIRGLTRVDRLLAMSAVAEAVEIVDLMRGEPAIQALLHVAQAERSAVDSRRGGRPTMIPHQLTRGIDALIARGRGSTLTDKQGR